MWCPWIVLSNRPWVIKFIIWEIISFVNSSKIIVRNLTFGGLPESRSDIDIKVPKSVAKIKMFNCPNLNKGDWLEFRTDLKITEQWNAVTQLQSFQNCPMSQLHDDYVSEKHILTWNWFAKKIDLISNDTCQIVLVSTHPQHSWMIRLPLSQKMKNKLRELAVVTERARMWENAIYSWLINRVLHSRINNDIAEGNAKSKRRLGRLPYMMSAKI